MDMAIHDLKFQGWPENTWEYLWYPENSWVQVAKHSQTWQDSSKHVWTLNCCQSETIQILSISIEAWEHLRSGQQMAKPWHSRHLAVSSLSTQMDSTYVQHLAPFCSHQRMSQKVAIHHNDLQYVAMVLKCLQMSSDVINENVWKMTWSWDILRTWQ